MCDVLCTTSVMMNNIYTYDCQHVKQVSNHVCNLNTLLLSADVTNVEAEPLKNVAGDPVQVAELQARIKELEMEQSLMQRELDNMSDVAQRTDNQLRYVLPQAFMNSMKPKVRATIARGALCICAHPCM